MLKDIRPGTYDSGPSYFTVLTSVMDKKDYLFFAASDGYMNYNMRDNEGIGGAQIWRTDGTVKGTSRAFDRSENDVHIDRVSLDAAFPARFAVYQHGLYVSASYGQYDRWIPSGGFKFDSNVSSYQVNQAVVIADVDTHPTQGNLSVTLHVDKGLLVLRDATQLGENSPKSLSFLVAESRTTDRLFLTNALIALGHSVEVVYSGEEAYEAVIARYSKSREVKHRGKVRPYDCVIMSLHFERVLNATNGESEEVSSWDGITTIRQLRWWETSQLAASASASASASLSLSESDAQGLPMKIIAMSKKFDSMVNVEAEMLSAGANLHLWQPTTDSLVYQNAYQSTSKGRSMLLLSDGRSTSLNMYVKMSEREEYNAMASVIVKYLYRVDQTINITSEMEEGQRESLTSEVLNGLPGLTLGHTLHLEGNVLEINAVLQHLFYFPPNGTRAVKDVSLTIEVMDQPIVCHSLSRSSNGEREGEREDGRGRVDGDLPIANPALPMQVAYYSTYLSRLTTNTGREGGALAEEDVPLFDRQGDLILTRLCEETDYYHRHDNRSRTVKTIPIYVVPCNQPPRMTFHRYENQTELITAADMLSMSLDVSTSLPTIRMMDEDIERVDFLTTSYGKERQPVYTMTFDALVGRLSFASLSTYPEVQVISGTSYLDRHTVLQGPFDKLNQVVYHGILYTCRSIDGCMKGFSDRVMVEVNDMGVYGKGGPLTYSQYFNITVV